MSRASRVRWTAVLTVLLATGVVGCANRPRTAGAGNRGQSRPAPHLTTVLTRFTPYTAAGALTVPVTAHATGSCWTASIETPVPGAYRCLVGNSIADPCFAAPAATAPPTVACVPDPWSGAEVVALSKPLPRTAPIANASYPWALELANGVRCVASSGMVQSVAGVSLNLRCLDGQAAGGLDRAGAMWQVKYGAASGSTLTSVAVTAAWRG